VDEDEVKTSFKAAGGSADEAAIALAELKAARIAATLVPDAIVLGADQILTCEKAWFDKPADRDAARSQLEALSGKQHELHTTVVAFRNGARIWHHVDLCRLWMRPLSREFLDRYLDLLGDDALETVGGYHIERFGPHLFSRIEGDHFSILGLPLLPTLAFLRDQGVTLK
jgi:septum formation protein